MNYQEAQKVRQKGFSETLTDKLLGGGGIRESFKSTLSEKSKAMGMGIKQKFDPLNIAKKLTFGSNLAPALLGKMTGRSKEDISFFSGGQKKEKEKLGKSAVVSDVAMDFATQILGDIYKVLQKTEEDRKLADDLEKNQTESKEDELNRRNDEIILAITGRKRKGETRREKARKKKEEVKEKKQTKRDEKEVKPVEGKPSARRATPSKVSSATATKAPVPPSGLATATKIGLGVAAAGTAASAIAGAESGGSYEITFGDRVDRKSGNVIRGKNLSPEQRFGKKLTELTLEEVDTLGKERNKQTMNTSATGKYQFMNRTLFGGKDKKGLYRPGLVQQLGLDPKTTKYTPEIQDKLFELLHRQDVGRLKQLGVPITPGFEYMAHYVGPDGAAAVFKARDTNMTVSQAIVSAGLPDPSKSNEELLRIKASDFEGILQSRLEKKGGLVVHATQQNGNLTGTTIDSSSIENQQLKKDLNVHQTKQVINNDIITNTNKTPSAEPVSGDDSSAYARKSKGKT